MHAFLCNERKREMLGKTSEKRKVRPGRQHLRNISNGIRIGSTKLLEIDTW